VLGNSPVRDAHELRWNTEREARVFPPQNDDLTTSYLATTPAVLDVILSDARPESALFRGGILEADAIAIRRMQLIALALYGQRDATRDRSFPQNLSDLVPRFFASLPTDPWTGGAFRWYPHGINKAFLFSHRLVARDEPFLEAAGPYLSGVREAAPSSTDEFDDRPPFEDRMWNRYSPNQIAYGAPVVPVPADR
jgi:hypothetical protein